MKTYSGDQELENAGNVRMLVKGHRLPVIILYYVVDSTFFME